MSYRKGLKPALKNLSFEVQAGEKIGIVGRTGAGKSSILQALFRLINITKGSVSIDGTDIRTLQVADLRSKLAYIP